MRKLTLSQRQVYRLVFIFLAIGFLFLFFRAVGDSLYSYEPISTIEAAAKPALIVVLAGGKGRIETAFELFALSNSTTLFVAGAGAKTSLNDIIKANIGKHLEAALATRMSSIVVEKESRNTIENAYAVARFLEQNPGFKEIILITSSYHMKRSLKIFHNIIKKEITVYPFNPLREPISRDNWFSTVNGIEVTFYEIAKHSLASIIVPQIASF